MQNQYIRSFIFLGIFVALTSCSSREISFIQEYFSSTPELYKKKINMNLLPKESFNKYNMIEDSTHSSIKVLNVVSFGCNSCMETLKKYDTFIKQSKVSSKLDIIFVILGDPNEYFLWEINRNKFEFPIYHDNSFTFLKENELNKYGNETFVLNSNNEIVLFGDILGSSILYKQFLKIIKKDHDS